MKLYDIAGALQTPYEEIHVARFGEVLLEREERRERQLHEEYELLDAHGEQDVAFIDCYYTGDHMYLSIDLM